MKTLAFLIDEMQSAKKLIRYAALLGKDLNAKVHVLHVQLPYVPCAGGFDTHAHAGDMGAGSMPDPAWLHEIEKDVKQTVKDYIKDIKKEFTDIPSIIFNSELGDASKILEDKVEKGVYDMVMLQGSSDRASWMQNPVAMDIVRKLPCPVFIIEPDTKYQPFKKIVYATDHKEEDVSTLKRLIHLGKPFSPEILTLHVTDDEQFRKKILKEGFDDMIREKVGYENVIVKVLEVDDDDKDDDEKVDAFFSECDLILKTLF
ncbi:MAG: universal stress protein, partial [Bacteroidales bacterium]